MFRLILMLAFLSVVGCAGPSTVDLDDQGVYHFQTESFQVRAPTECIENMSVQEDSNSVRFTTGRGNWQADGDYRVEIYNVPQAGSDEEHFLAVARGAYLDTMAAAGNRVKSSEDIQVNGRPAFQGLASDESKAMVLGTNILFPDHIVMTQLLYPSVPGEDDVDDLPLECYQRLIESIEYAPSEPEG